MVAFWPGEREPKYNGKTLSQWLWIVGTNSTTDRQIINDTTNLASITNELPQVLDAVRAVRAIGTNALPYLIRWTLDSPKWRRNLASAYYSKCPKFLNSDAVGNWIYGEDQNKFAGALVGFQIMGPDEVYAIPEMVRLLKESDSDVTKMHVLACLGPCKSRARLALPVLREMLARSPWRNWPVEDVMNQVEPGSADYFRTNVLHRPF